MDAAERVKRAKKAHRHFNGFLDEFCRHMDDHERGMWFDTERVNWLKREIEIELRDAYYQLGLKVDREVS